MNLVPEMNLKMAEKFHFKNTQVLKKNLFVVLGHFIRYFTTLLKRSDRADVSHSFFWSRATEQGGATFLEWSLKKSQLQNKRSLSKSVALLFKVASQTCW